MNEAECKKNHTHEGVNCPHCKKYFDKESLCLTTSLPVYDVFLNVDEWIEIVPDGNIHCPICDSCLGFTDTAFVTLGFCSKCQKYFMPKK